MIGKEEEQAMAIFKQHYNEWKSHPDRMKSGYDYESTFTEMTKKLSLELLQSSVGEAPKDKNKKKKVQTIFGKVEPSKGHVLSQSPFGLATTSFAQELLCHAGQHLVFEDASKLANSFLGDSITNAKQIERICHNHGQAIEDIENKLINEEVYKTCATKKANEQHYVSVDGAMYLTREESWKENKLGRIFRSENIVKISKNRRLLTNSEYVTHLGKAKDFTKKMDYHLENLNNLVFLADGARWIWNWVNQNYPESIQIVDYYHALQHLYEFANLYYKAAADPEKKEWIASCSKTMLEQGIDPIIKKLKELPKRARVKQKYNALIAYYQRNKDRMQYPEYKKKGLLIGSGAIEAAHRNVLQQRLKLSGQRRWTKEGFQQMAQLRVVYKSGKEHLIKNLCKKTA